MQLSCRSREVAYSHNLVVQLSCATLSHATSHHTRNNLVVQLSRVQLSCIVYGGLREREREHERPNKKVSKCACMCVCDETV